MFYNEVFSNPEVQLPEIVTLPEKADDWILWETPKQVVDLAKKHEDKTMIAKWAFQKPELTYYHVKNIMKILEDHYLMIQMIPIQKFAILFNDLVLENK